MPRLREPTRRTRPVGAGSASIREVCLLEARGGRAAWLEPGDRLRRGGRDYRVTTVHQSPARRSYVHLAALGDPIGPS